MCDYSIIVPVYNVKDYIKECVDSILSQTIESFELILVDDGSSDGSSEICDKYAGSDSRVVVKHKANGGVSSARNMGLDIAKGSFIVFVDSDDWVTKDYLSTFNVRKSDADLYIQGLQFVNSKTGLVSEEKDLPDLVLDKEAFPIQIPKYNILALGFPVCKCYRKNIIEQNHLRFNESISHHEDHIFVFDYLLHTSKIQLNAGLQYNYRYFHNPKSLSSSSHSIESMSLASKEMLSRLNSICDLFCIRDGNYISLMTHLCLIPVMGATVGLYKDDGSNHFRRLRQFLPPTSLIKHCYFPSDNCGRVIKFFASRRMFLSLHLFLSVYSHLR